MFCAGCGMQIQSGLNYCNRCGRRVAEEVAKPAWSNPLVIAGNTAGVGFVGFIFILLILTKYGPSSNIFVPITFFYFAALFGICLMILRHGGSAANASEPASSADDSHTPAYLRPVTTAQLEEGREVGIGSVTDATTRTLDHVPLERK